MYTFKIRPNLKFTDGHVLDAYAVKANFDALIDNKTRHSWLEMMRLLEGVAGRAVVALDKHVDQLALGGGALGGGGEVEGRPGDLARRQDVSGQQDKRDDDGRAAKG